MMRSASESSNMIRQKHPKVRDAMPSATAAAPVEGRGADMVRQAQVRVESSGDLRAELVLITKSTLGDKFKPQMLLVWAQW